MTSCSYSALLSAEDVYEYHAPDGQAYEAEKTDNSQKNEDVNPANTSKRTEYTLDGTLDWNGRPAHRSTTGGWKAAKYIIAEQVFVNLSYFGLCKNLVMYLTTVMHQGNADASNFITNWLGAVFIAPFLGAFMADSNCGRYWTTFVFSALFGIGVLLVAISTYVPSLRPPQCPSRDVKCESATAVQSTFLTIGLYVAGIANGALTPPVTVLGADQFDDDDPIEKKERSSYFNWIYQAITIGAMGAAVAIVTIQEDLSWGLGMTISAGLAFIGMFFFVFASKLYRFHKLEGNAVMRIAQVMVAATRKIFLPVTDVNKLYEETDPESTKRRKICHTDDYKILDKAALWTPEDEMDVHSGGKINHWSLCCVTQVEEVKSVLRLLPIFCTTIIYATVYMQMTTIFVVQGAGMDTRMFGSFKIPSASLSVVEQITIVIGVVMYDKWLVPVLRRYTGHPKGFTDLKRMGVGLFLSILSMVVSALVEAKRLQAARDSNLLQTHLHDDTTTPVPLSILWLIPQYFLIGFSEIFVFIGLLEMFYDQCPESLRSVSNAIQLFTNAAGSYLSTVLVTLVNKFTRSDGEWIPNDNLNTGHVDRFYWLLAVLSLINFVLFVLCAMRYKPLEMEHYDTPFVADEPCDDDQRAYGECHDGRDK
ncbi:protein MpNPF34 [Marchantia polymorpha subsp. ruderalis]|uniref:Major facilitator superfamily (MFS) profile domain-containing protein n=1 Tax=Marchantia polymorpha TaxID=3197 RepID=A0A2R6W0H3_MARPO|nr:hypothetical protein MARPO_0204s0004 [Marchantia polymorpha]BBN19297.1 hypothetical protein Mp_8g09440 [Marchantia polymorpha subsp. ruderalis]|eukprot:PTQ27334.1 hypothetical protein MARPO_0204s0004 [Marchantia polymorpha]